MYIPNFKHSASLRNVISITYLTLVITITTLCGFYYYDTKDQANIHVNAQMQHMAKLRSHDVELMLAHNINTMKILGTLILHQDPDLLNKEFLLDTINTVDANSDIISAIGVTRTSDGQLMAVSTIALEDDLPNHKTLTGDEQWEVILAGEVSIGRTYYLDLVGTTLIPVRLLVTNGNGTNVVISTGITISNDQNIFFESAEPELEQNLTYIIRTDGYLQFSTDRTVSEFELYEFNYNDYPTDVYRNIENTGKLFMTTSIFNDENVVAVMQYNEKYGFNTVITLPESAISAIIQDRIDNLLLIYFLVLGMSFVSMLVMSSMSKQFENKLIKQANFDALTGLPNRAHLSDELRIRIEYAEKHNRTVGIFFVDLDDFKSVNDTYNHTVGDKLLIEIARRFKDILRSTDFVARLGGDEFIVITSQEDPDPRRAAMNIKTIAKQIHSATTEKVEIDENLFIYSSSSIGVAMYPQHAGNQDELLRKADVAMYHAKNSLKKNLVCYTPEVEYEQRKLFGLKQSLHEAIKTDACKDFYLEFQPQFRLHDNTIVGFESLIRWKNKRFPGIGPDQFIPIVEEMNLIGLLGDWVLDESLKEWAMYKATVCSVCSLHDGPVVISVNMSSLQFKQKDQVGNIIAKLEKYGIGRNELSIEITESNLISEDIEIEALTSVTDAGISVSIDDFGTGYSSLQRLSAMEFTAIKIDKSFIDQIGHDIKGEAMIHTILLLGTKLGAEIVAEGVETKEQCAFLYRHDPEIIIQGYIYSAPVRLENMQAVCDTEFPDLTTLI